MNMKKTLVIRLLVVAVISTSFFSCNKSRDYKDSSRATGWKLNDKDGGFQYNPQAKEQETGPGLVFVEGGTYTMGRVQDDPMRDWNNTPTQQHVQSFYMDETEVTNLMYLEYLDWTKKVFPVENENYRKIYEGVLPDTLVWRNRLGFNEVMTNNYLRHPAYALYPVVGVSWIQAVEFSKWRTDRVNEIILETEGFTKRGARISDVDANTTFNTYTYLNTPENAYGGNAEITQGGKTSERKVGRDSTGLYVQLKDGLLLPDYRLPTEAEWEYAALGLGSLRSYNVYRGKKKYPWDGQYTRSGKRKTRGDQMANFKQGKGDYGGIAGWSDDGADITAEVKSYEPNDFGLYDMAGNVAEWVADVYRPIIDDQFNDFNYFRGNIYTKNSIGEDGKVQIVTSEDIVYDTLSNGKIVARNLPGEILQVPVDDEDTYLRTNFSESDNRNYRDGDKRSTRTFQSFNEFEEEEEESSTSKMYNSPVHSVETDSIGNLDRQYDQANNRTTLINDKVRVYKGGSWRDRNYWLDPAQRRYFPQEMATDYIGFRNAMSRVGSKSKTGKKPRN
ncbi:MAG: gliding motility lipoprotein GldJ [Flavobacteriaceae bacterium CG_4_8_14_3_um_filter_34_10]|nr:MAG: gliding motility lipoprotein GldJ [Flavobacteriaceae bacterium CG18_big_fil_WC_8_21_14_2_50_34_36]PIV51411.1 MAG: gliding motility lipoprotein GldJ [Flavobacteriaceae bacterium CG02_land_8_20_14_3_00_34_13]PIX09457.1 MAG: gliding motility lipoprotein GldJ [Flavobacteriaceae bacterium CG_4_8_14_3_um_filter_34_10]